MNELMKHSPDCSEVTVLFFCSSFDCLKSHTFFFLIALSLVITFILYK